MFFFIDIHESKLSVVLFNTADADLYPAVLIWLMLLTMNMIMGQRATIITGITRAINNFDFIVFMNSTPKV